MKHNSRLAALKIFIVSAMLLSFAFIAACGGKMINNNKQQEYHCCHISFDENGGDYVIEELSKQKYDVSYVFSDAEYKKSQSAKRVSGVSGNALLFDGYSTYIDIDGIDDCANALTVSVWVAPRAYENRGDKKLTGIVSSLDKSGGFELGMYNYGTWCFKINTDMGAFRVWSNDSVIDLYKWNYITAVFDGNTNKIKLYKNGKLVADNNVPANIINATSCKTRIGIIQDPFTIDNVFYANMFSGLIDELEICATALSPEEISDKYNMYANKSLNIENDLWLDSNVLADDRYAPQYHMRTSQNWQNETYGFFYYNGYYHAFCQQNVFGPFYNEGQRWGHFISTDLIHWEETIPALTPEPNGIDNNNVFSGSAILDAEGKPKLFYTGVNYGAAYLNQISTSSPSNPADSKLQSWTKSGKVVVEQGVVSNRDNFRDPFIYRENGEYFMLIGATNNNSGDGAVYCYKATDESLESWQYLSLFYSGDTQTFGYLGNCYEMPTLFKLNNKSNTISKYMFLFSPINGTNNGVYYLLGDFNTQTGLFIPDRDEPYRYDLGPVSQVLCPSGFYDTNTNRNLLITMSRTGLSSEERYKSGWSNIMTLIKEVYLSDEGEPIFKPIDEYNNLTNECLLQIDECNSSVEEINSLIGDISGDMLKVEIEIDPGTDTKIGLYLKYDADGVEKIDLSYNTISSVFYIDTSKSSTAMRNNGSGGGAVDLRGENLKLTVYIDRAMAEAYLNGKNQLTAFGYNYSQFSNKLKLHSNGDSARVKSIAIYKLKSSRGETVDAHW